MRVADIVRAADELGATYPDIVQMLMQASEQRNLEARLETDALPESGRVYQRPAAPDRPTQKTKVGREHLSPNLFPRFEDKDNPNREDGQQALLGSDGADGMSNVPAGNADSEDTEQRRSVWKFWERSKDKDR
jgi:hypothetical protein